MALEQTLTPRGDESCPPQGVVLLLHTEWPTYGTTRPLKPAPLTVTDKHRVPRTPQFAPIERTCSLPKLPPINQEPKKITVRNTVMLSSYPSLFRGRPQHQAWHNSTCLCTATRDIFGPPSLQARRSTTLHRGGTSTSPPVSRTTETLNGRNLHSKMPEKSLRK